MDILERDCEIIADLQVEQYNALPFDKNILLRACMHVRLARTRGRCARKHFLYNLLSESSLQWSKLFSQSTIDEKNHLLKHSSWHATKWSKSILLVQTAELDFWEAIYFQDLVWYPTQVLSQFWRLKIFVISKAPLLFSAYKTKKIGTKDLQLFSSIAITLSQVQE